MSGAEKDNTIAAGGWLRLAIALLSASALAYEILLMRLFSIIQWHHFAYMIISLALLGYGASGTFLAIFRRSLLQRFAYVFSVNALLFGVSSLGLFLLAQRIPFNAQEILWDSSQIVYLFSLYLLLALPFFFAANAMGMALIHYRHDISRLYAADMLGAGVGSMAIILMLFVLFPENALRILSAAGMLAAVIACWGLGIWRRLRWLFLVFTVLPILLPSGLIQLTLSPYKSLSQWLNIEGTEVVAEYSSPLGLLSVLKSPIVPLRHAPGLSLMAKQEPPRQVGVFTDGDAMTVINEDTGDRERLAFLDELTSALPYHLGKPERVLVLGAGGGSEVLQAHFHGAKEVEAVELNAQMIRLVQQDYGAFSGHLYDEKRTRVHQAEARGFVSGSKDHYDLIQVALLDAFNASSAGLYALNESYLYTVEALQDYLDHLTPNGILAISRWIKLPPRDTLKLFATAVEAAQQKGEVQAASQLVLIRSWQTSTLLIKNNAFTSQEIAALRQFCEQRAFDVAYYPGMAVSEANRYNRLRRPLFFEAAQALLGVGRKDFLDNYKFNIRPATDDQPYFFNFFKWQALPEILEFMGRGGLPLLELGYLILIATLLQALVASLMLILLPLFFLRRESTLFLSNGMQPWRVFGYFSALGLAFLFLEIAFIQRFILYLHHPLYAVAVVLSAFLLFAGFGSAYSKHFSQRGEYIKGIRWAVIGIAGLGGLYLALLGPLFSLSLDWPAGIKVVIAIILIAPLAFCMGMPFPLGLGIVALQNWNLTPWAWGINGCASVVSAVLATLLAIHLGFNVVLVLALLLYGMAVLILPSLGLETVKEGISP
jgi:spermidine synthase